MKYFPVRKLDELTKRIVALMPPLEDFFLSDDNIEENSKKIYPYSPGVAYIDRQKPFFDLIEKKIGRIFTNSELEFINVPSLSGGLKGGVRGEPFTRSPFGLNA
jgi:hypothetical protein